MIIKTNLLWSLFFKWYCKNAVVVGYEKAKKELADMEKKLNEYKKEHAMLKAENKSNNEEKELTK